MQKKEPWGLYTCYKVQQLSTEQEFKQTSNLDFQQKYRDEAKNKLCRALGNFLSRKPELWEHRKFEEEKLGIWRPVFLYWISSIVVLSLESFIFYFKSNGNWSSIETFIRKSESWLKSKYQTLIFKKNKQKKNEGFFVSVYLIS